MLASVASVKWNAASVLVLQLINDKDRNYTMKFPNAVVIDCSL